ncbi:hypothetical protein Tco_0635658 [Tanacetum coccineum]
MTSKAQQIELDNALVTPENRRVIGKCNMRINPGMKPKEPTYQVALDALALTTCYPAFLITAEVSYILNICPRISGQEFNEPPTEEEALSFIRELGHSGEIKYITDVIIDHLHQPWRNFASIINKCLCGKVYGVEPSKSRKSLKKSDSAISFEESPSKNKSAKAKKVAGGWGGLGQPYNLNRLEESTGYGRQRQGFECDGTDFESRVPDEQHRKTAGVDEGTGTKPGVPNVPEYDSESDKESWGDSEEEDDDDEDDTKCNDDYDDDDNDDNKGDDDDDNDANDDDNQEDDDTSDDDEETDSDRTKSDKIKIPVVKQSSTEYYEEEEEEEKIDDEKKIDEEEDDEVTKELYNDVNVNLGNRDADMTDAIKYAQALSSIPAILDRYIDNKLEEAIQKAILAHNLDCREEAQVEKRDYIELVDTSMRVILKEEVNTQLPQILPQAVSDFATHVIEKNVTKSLEATVLARSSSQPNSTYEAAALLSEGVETTKTKIKTPPLDQTEGRKEGSQARKLSHPEIQGQRKRSLQAPLKNASHSQHKSSSKSVHEEEPSHTVDNSGVQQNQEFDTCNNDEQPANKEVSKADCQVARAKEPRTLFDELMDISFDFSAFVLNWLNIKDLTQEILVGPAFELLKGTCKSLIELEYHIEECSKAKTERLDWHNPEGKPHPFNLSKPLLLIPDHQGRQVIPQDFFINNDLEYLKGRDLSRRYSTSVTKIKPATYEIKWIEDLVQNL